MRVEAKALGAALKRVSHAVAPDGRWGYLYLETTVGAVDGPAFETRVVGSDGVRLAVAELPLVEPTELDLVALDLGDLKSLLYYLARVEQVAIALREGATMVTFYEKVSALTLPNHSKVSGQPNAAPPWRKLAASLEGVPVLSRLYNAAYISEAAAALPEARLNVPHAPDKPLTVTAPGYTEWLMPIREGQNETPPTG